MTQDTSRQASIGCRYHDYQRRRVRWPYPANDCESNPAHTNGQRQTAKSRFGLLSVFAAPRTWRHGP